MGALKTNKSLNVCVIAYACTPYKGSEEGLGWAWTVGLSNYANIILITRKNNVIAMKNDLLAKGIANVDIIGIDWPVWVRFWKKGAKFAMLYHYIWQWLAANKVGQLTKNTEFDFVLHLNFAVTWQPCWVAYKTKTIFGPVDGQGWIPPKFWKVIGIKSVLSEIVRALILWFGEYCDPFVRSSIHKSFLIVCRNKFVASRLEQKGYKVAGIIPDACIDENFIKKVNKLFETHSNPESTETVKIVFAGRLVTRKGVSLALEAFSRSIKIHNNMEFTIIGDGPEILRLKQLVSNLNISDKVVFSGNIDRELVLLKMLESDIFLYPSLRDGLPSVILEAMVARLPIICLDGIGPAQVVNKNNGITVKVGSNSHQTIVAISDAINLLVIDPKLRKKMSDFTKKEVINKHTIDSRTKSLVELYRNSQ